VIVPTLVAFGPAGTYSGNKLHQYHHRWCFAKSFTNFGTVTLKGILKLSHAGHLVTLAMLIAGIVVGRNAQLDKLSNIGFLTVCLTFSNIFSTREARLKEIWCNRRKNSSGSTCI
jgi:hypothetical protein